MTDSKTVVEDLAADGELQTCIYNHYPHECDHWVDDAEYHARKNEDPCIPAPVERQGVEQ